MRSAARAPRLRMPVGAFVLLFSWVLGASDLGAQILSPGELARAHAELEGVRNCTACHQLRQRGVSQERCLECHEPLAARIEAGLGYHGSLVDRDCGRCHKDHLGRDFDLVRLDEPSFPHADTGFDLEDAHGSTDCRDCHRPDQISDSAVRSFKNEHGALERTFLGLSTECATCHGDEDRHGSQFGSASCDDCHAATSWSEAPRFDHARARFVLDGSHRRVECSACHEADASSAVRYRPLAFGECGTCHDDPHGSRMSDRCSTCHVTDAWSTVSAAVLESAFDHETTGFSLAGAHAAAACESCHVAGAVADPLVRIVFRERGAGSAFRRPAGSSCASCHVDVHRGTAGSDAESCEACHRQGDWTPSTFGVDRHNGTGVWSLTGAHAVTPCIVCHVPAAGGGETHLLFEVGTECVSCHGDENPHGDRYRDRGCDACHGTDTFSVGAVDHTRPGFTGSAGGCVGCHAADDPHREQFGERDCGACHETGDFAIPDYSHVDTAFPLDGAHQTVACASCHLPEVSPSGETFTRYRPLGTSCVDCHGGRR